MKGRSLHRCMLAAAAPLVGTACIPDLPPDSRRDAASVETDAGSDADAALDAQVGSDGGFDADAAKGCGDGFIDLEAGEQCDPGRNAAGLASVCTATCRVACPAGFLWTGNDHCYLSVGSTNDLMPGAFSACQGVSGHVATFASEAEFEAVDQEFNFPMTDPQYWVGLTNSAGRSYVSVVTGYEPGWDPTCPGCYAHTAIPKAGLPRYVDADGGLSSQACVGASSDVLDPTWHQRPCTNVKTHVVCEREPVGALFAPCDAGACGELVATRGVKRYVLVTQPATSDAAAQSCASLGGRLVVLQTRDEREQLWRQIALSAPLVFRVWIGLSLKDAGADGGTGDSSWVWDDGTEADLPDAYAPPWGDRLPMDGGTTTRAYLRAYMGEIDDTLARNDEPLATVRAMPFVCEIATPRAP